MFLRCGILERFLINKYIVNNGRGDGGPPGPNTQKRTRFIIPEHRYTSEESDDDEPGEYNLGHNLKCCCVRDADTWAFLLFKKSDDADQTGACFSSSTSSQRS